MSAMIDPKRQKTYHFHKEWEEDYFFVMSNSKCVCLICQATISLPKKGNLERHFTTMHKRYEKDFPSKSELRKISKQILQRINSSLQDQLQLN